ncbi:MAG: caspase family protein [Gallionella sp.]|nr:caspase family protein [Gallionella sp.]
MRFALKLAVIAIAACFSPLALANPVGPTVVNGAATIVNNGNTLTVTNTPGAILNWQQFNIGQGQTTQFIQQSAQSSVLNRVTGPDPSQILGTMRSNGQVFLINPNGIMFGAGAVIDVNRLIASTLNITNADFLANNLKFNGNNGTSVINQGQITTPFGGSVYLIGNDVTNQGVITTPQGEVVLAAGNSVSLVNSVTPHISVTVSAGGQALNLGQVTAQGGSINIYGALVKQQGIVSADSASVDAQGHIVLSATQSVDLAQGSITSAKGATGGNITIESGATGSTTVAGTVAATGNLPSPAGGRGAGGEGVGGTIKVLGNTISLTDTAILDASGAAGGGTILVGGDYQGKNAAVQNAFTTNIAQGATLKADGGVPSPSGGGLGWGNGGKIIAWSDNDTRAYGSFSARGGALSGNGGLIETSGHYLDVAGIRIDAAALNGTGGLWLLDPINVTIGPGAPNGALSGSAITDGTINQALDTGTNVTISTACCGGGLPGDITLLVGASVSKSVSMAAPTLTFNADGIINILGTINSIGNGLNVSLNGLAVWIDGGGVSTSSGNLSINATNGVGILNGGSVDTANGNVNISAKHFLLGSAATAVLPATFGRINAGTGGNVTISTTGVHAATGMAVEFEAVSEVLASSLTINGTSVAPGIFNPSRSWAAPSQAPAAATQTCLTNPALCASTPVVVNNQTTATTTGALVVIPPTTAGATGNITYSPAPAVIAPATDNLPTATAPATDTASTTVSTVSTTPAAASNNDILQAKSEARKAEDDAQKADDRVNQAKTPQEKATASQYAEVKSGEATVKSSEAKIRAAESEIRAAESEVASGKTPQEKARAETRKAVAESKQAEGEVEKASAEVKLAEAEAKGAKTAATKAVAEVKKSEAEAKKAEADVKKAEVDVKKAETELKQAEAEAKTGGSSEAKAAVEAKKAEVESKKAEAEIKKAEVEAKSAKDPADKAAAESKLAKAEVKKADAEAKKADVEAKLADADAKSSKSPVAKLVAETKKAEAEAKKAEAEVKKAEAEVKSTNDPEKKAKADVKVAEAEVKKADAEAKKAEAEVKVAEAAAKGSNNAEDKKDVEDKKAEAQVKKAEAQVKKAEVEVKKAKAPSEKEAAEINHSEAEARMAEAEYKSAEREAKRDKDEANAPQSGYLRKAVDKKAEATAVKAEAKKVEYEAKKLAVEAKRAEVEMKQAEADVAEAKTPEARVEAEKRFEVKRAEVKTKQGEAQAKEQKVASLKAEAAGKETEYKDAKRSSNSKIIDTFGGMSLASMAKERVQEAMIARHEFKAETLKPALSILKAEPTAADLKPCGPGSGDVCMRPVNPALGNLAVDVMPRVRLPLPTPATSFLPTIQRKVAVVIGNNAYQDPNIPSLDGAVKDADAIGKLFKEKMGYDVRMVHNGTRADIVRTLNQISDETGSKDSVVVYYAGHGYQMEDTKVGYWIPSDASTKDPSKWISNSDINKMLTNIPAKQMILVSDSCYSGALTSEQKVTSAVAGKNAQEILGKRSVLVMSSGGEEPVMDEGRDGHSIFAWHLMDRLNNVDQYKNGTEVFEAVKDGVAKDGIPQTPQYGASLSAGHMAGGEYLFEVRKY